MNISIMLEQMEEDPDVEKNPFVILLDGMKKQGEIITKGLGDMLDGLLVSVRKEKRNEEEKICYCEC